MNVKQTDLQKINLWLPKGRGRGKRSYKGYGLKTQLTIYIKQIRDRISQGIIPMTLVITYNGMYLQKS